MSTTTTEEVLVYVSLNHVLSKLVIMIITTTLVTIFTLTLIKAQTDTQEDEAVVWEPNHKRLLYEI